MERNTSIQTIEEQERSLDWACAGRAPTTEDQRATANPAENPKPRGNQDIDEYDCSRGRERFLAVLGS
ncbi:MAG: hypothetical protein ACJ76V_08850 [Thermoleophilaceae bacterium]